MKIVIVGGVAGGATAAARIPKVYSGKLYILATATDCLNKRLEGQDKQKHACGRAFVW